MTTFTQPSAASPTSAPPLLPFCQLSREDEAYRLKNVCPSRRPRSRPVRHENALQLRHAPTPASTPDDVCRIILIPRGDLKEKLRQESFLSFFFLQCTNICDFINYKFSRLVLNNLMYIIFFLNWYHLISESNFNLNFVASKNVIHFVLRIFKPF